MQAAAGKAQRATASKPPPAKNGSTAVPHKAHTIGDGIDDELGDQLRRETRHQDDILDQVDAALDQVKHNAKVRDTGICDQSQAKL